MAAFLLLSAVSVRFAAAQATTVHDPAALKPPPGARVAIVEFEDMECPDCARANPLLKDAAAQYHIPWVRHDFPLPFHAWSFDAAVYARWFDTKSKKMGDDFRDAVFANQQLIDAAGETSPETPAGPTTAASAAIHNFAEKFAQQHGVALPFVSIRKRSWLLKSRRTSIWVSASASSTRRPSGWSPTKPTECPLSKWSTGSASTRSSTRRWPTPRARRHRLTTAPGSRLFVLREKHFQEGSAEAADPSASLGMTKGRAAFHPALASDRDRICSFT